MDVPTAVHQVAAKQATPASDEVVLAGVGADWGLQVVPLDVVATATLDGAEPTAVQALLEVHDTLCRFQPVVPAVDWTLQVVPFQCSARAEKEGAE